MDNKVFTETFQKIVCLKCVNYEDGCYPYQVIGCVESFLKAYSMKNDEISLLETPFVDKTNSHKKHVI